MTAQTLGRRLAPVALALAAMAMAAMSCQKPQTVSPGGPGAGQATPTYSPVTQDWRAASPLPQQGGAPVVFTAAPSDGRVIYACGYAPPGYPAVTHLWSSADSGATWGAPATVLAQRATSSCQVTVDQSDPQRALAFFDTVNPDPQPSPANYTALLTENGGATWLPQPVAGPRVTASLATYNGATFAAGGGLKENGQTVSGVWTSGDGGVTWASPGTNPLGSAPHIWVNPQTGEMIGEDQTGALPALWRSRDSGQTWTAVTTPLLAGAGGWQSLVVAPNGADWWLCVAAVTTAGPTGQNALACSTTLGVSWRSMPADNPVETPVTGPGFSPIVVIYAIASDGGLLGVYSTSAGAMSFVRLAPGATRWETLMPPPGANGMQTIPMYSTGPGAGVITAVGRDSRTPMFTTTYP